MLVVSGTLPLYSSAAVIPYAPESSEKNAALSGGFSLSAPNFRMSEESDGGKLVPVPDMGDIRRSTYRGRSYLPETFDLRDIGGITSVKNQGSYGTCWTHAAAASAESSVIRSQPFVDLSEFHAAFYTYYGSREINDSSDLEQLFNIGGNCFYVANLWSQWIGPVNESRFPYGDLSFYNNISNTDIKKYESAYHMRNAYMFDYDGERTNFSAVNELVKEFVYSGLAVDVSFQSDSVNCYDSGYNSTRSERKPRFANHAVTIAGWDDNFPKENFRNPADIDGAWLVKNSWGESSFDNGYMWISYDDRSLCEFSVYELDDAEEYSMNFHHDTYVPIQSMSACESDEEIRPSYMANVFHTSYDTQIEAVSVYIAQPYTDYEITVYTGLNDISDPTSGTASGVTCGTAEITGHMTIELDKDMPISGGEDFSVVVKMYCADSPYVIPVESALAVYDEEADMHIDLGSYASYDAINKDTLENQSFYSEDGVKWFDISDEEYIYTDDEKEEILNELEADLYDGIYPDETELLKNAADTLEVYREIFGYGPLSVKLGNITLKALGNPVNTVDFSHPSGIIADGEQVELSVKDGSAVYYSINNADFELYTVPITIGTLDVIRATADFETFTERSYISAENIPESGDVDADGLVDASDASAVLTHYSDISTGSKGTLCKAALDYADFYSDGLIDANDASGILELYSKRSTQH